MFERKAAGGTPAPLNPVLDGNVLFLVGAGRIILAD